MTFHLSADVTEGVDTNDGVGSHHERRPHSSDLQAIVDASRASLARGHGMPTSVLDAGVSDTGFGIVYPVGGASGRTY